MNPPEGIPSQVRYNSPGISPLYMQTALRLFAMKLSIYGESNSIDFMEFLL